MSDAAVADLPGLALSVRQPWAWAIIHAGKDIENRSWNPQNPALRQRGRIAIHAAKGMTKGEYLDAAELMLDDLGITCPPAAELLRGGIIGTVEISGAVRKSASPWFFGPVGLVLRAPQPCAFVPAKGQLSFFRWSPDAVGAPSPPARWMRDSGASP